MATKVNGTVKSIKYSAGGAVTVVVDYGLPEGEKTYDPVPADLVRGFERAQDREPPLKVDVDGDPPACTSVKTHA